MSTISFEDRAVAFVDVLGFSTLVSKAGSDLATIGKLQSLVDILSSAVPMLDETVNLNVSLHLIPKHTYFSDSIILSAPMSDATVECYNGLEVVVMRVIQLTHHLLNAGYLLRGGLSVGKVWQTDSNIIGPAYQEAYAIEAKAEDPCVALSPSAAAIWKNGFCGSSRMCLCKDSWNRSKSHRLDDVLIVNGLHDFYIFGNTAQDAIEQKYEQYGQIVKSNIASDLPDSAKKKWIWFNTLLMAERSEAAK